jgi:apolipoprotein N-acyltransferase
LPALAALAYGTLTLRGSTPGADSARVPIAITQANFDLGTRWRGDLLGLNLDVYLQLTAEAGHAGSPRMVFWPEAAMTFFLEDEPGYRRAIAMVTDPADLELVAGGPRSVRTASDERFFNSVYVLDPDGSERARYDKQYLIPFSEYFPFDIDVLRRRFGRIRVFQHGEQTAPVPTRLGLAGVLVCNEAMLPEVAADRVARGAVYLVNPSNDTWISDPKYVQQQFDIAVFRAIEQRRYLVRASTSGPSAVVDPFGRVLVQTQPLAREYLLGEVRPVRDRSLYGRAGDSFGVLCVLTVAIAITLRRPPSASS